VEIEVESNEESDEGSVVEIEVKRVEKDTDVESFLESNVEMVVQRAPLIPQSLLELPQQKSRICLPI
jgi:hypothetical protein